MSVVKEAYESMIEFNKVIISISTGLLAALIAYLVYQQVDFVLTNYISVIILVFSLIFSLYGMGRAVNALQTDTDKNGAIIHSNLGAIVLIAGILCLTTIKNNNKESIDSILKSVESSTASMNKKLKPSACYNIEKNNQNYILLYKTDTISTQVIYSLSENHIVSIK